MATPPSSTTFFWAPPFFFDGASHRLLPLSRWRSRGGSREGQSACAAACAQDRGLRAAGYPAKRTLDITSRAPLLSSRFLLEPRRARPAAAARGCQRAEAFHRLSTQSGTEVLERTSVSASRNPACADLGGAEHTHPPQHVNHIFSWRPSPRPDGPAGALQSSESAYQQPEGSRTTVTSAPVSSRTRKPRSPARRPITAPSTSTE